MDGFIGYSTQGHETLINEIENNKKRLLDILNSFDEVYTAINNCWIGEDATKYVEELKKVVELTTSNVDEIYNALKTQCTTTYEEWVAKQGA